MQSRSLGTPTFIPEGTLHGAPTSTIRGRAGACVAILGGGTRLDDAFRVDRTLGSGGTAIVRLARQLSLDRDVAIKTPLHADSLDAVNRVLQEAWVTGALEHPGVVPVHDVATDEAGVPHIVMRRIEGWTWTELLATPDAVRERFGVRDVLAWHLRVWMSVAATVHHAHARGVLHRDLKPDNVMIGPAGEVYVLDWGLAVALGEEAARYLPRAADTSGLAGTPRFMAPEMARPDGVLDVRTDVYLLGGLLYAILTGEGPHAGETVESTLAAIPSFQASFPADTPARLAAVCVAALATDPAERPRDAEGFRRLVSAWLEDRDTDALVETGSRELDALRTARSAEASDEEIVRRYAAARVAFEQALARSPSSRAAAAGLASARQEVVRHELGRDNVAAAAVVLAEVEDPPADLVRAVRAARAAADAKAAAAAKLLADADPTAGVRTRTFVSFVLGVTCVGVPLLTGRYAPDPTIPQLLGGDLALVALSGGLWFWARDSLGRSALNRLFIRTITAAPVIQAVLVVGAEPLGLSSRALVALFALASACLCVATAAAVEPWMLVPAGAYLAAYVLGIARPAHVWEILAAGNGMLVVVTLARWGPAGLRSWRALRREKRAEAREARG